MRTSQKIYLPFKRFLGILGSLIGITLSAALFWWWIIPVNAIVTKGHPFFLHERLGKNKKVFHVIKFRSMKMNANAYLSPSDMSASIQHAMETKFGSFLRKSSLDETPQLLNVFIGQMAFIGPRPGAAKNEEELIELRESYTPNAYDVRPGLSGYAQMKMNRDPDPAKKALYDHEYVAKLSFWFDFKIFWWTIFKIFGLAKGR